MTSYFCQNKHVFSPEMKRQSNWKQQTVGMMQTLSCWGRTTGGQKHWSTRKTSQLSSLSNFDSPPGWNVFIPMSSGIHNDSRVVCSTCLLFLADKTTHCFDEDRMTTETLHIQAHSTNTNKWERSVCSSRFCYKMLECFHWLIIPSCLTRGSGICTGRQPEEWFLIFLQHFRDTGGHQKHLRQDGCTTTNNANKTNHWLTNQTADFFIVSYDLTCGISPTLPPCTTQ